MKRIGGLSSLLIVGLCSIIVGVFSAAGTALANVICGPVLGCALQGKVLRGPSSQNLGFTENTTEQGTTVTFDGSNDSVSIDFAPNAGGAHLNGTFSASMQSAYTCPATGAACGIAKPLSGSFTAHDTTFNDDLNGVWTNSTMPTGSVIDPNAGGMFGITGGTGRFAGATGSGTWTFNELPVFGGDPTLNFWTGTITLPPPCTASFAGCSVRVSLVQSGATLASRLVNAKPVGILVERILAHRLVSVVGRVPFGRHHKGRLRIHWNLRVNGHKLPPGRYRITLRALDAHRHVVGAAAPVTITIH